MTDNVTPQQATAVRDAVAELARAVRQAESARRYASAEAYQSARRALVDAFDVNDDDDD